MTEPTTVVLADAERVQLLNMHLDAIIGHAEAALFLVKKIEADEKIGEKLYRATKCLDQILDELTWNKRK